MASPRIWFLMMQYASLSFEPMSWKASLLNNNLFMYRFMLVTWILYFSSSVSVLVITQRAIPVVPLTCLFKERMSLFSFVDGVLDVPHLTPEDLLGDPGVPRVSNNAVFMRDEPGTPALYALLKVWAMVWWKP